jgi:hypothetical protein
MMDKELIAMCDVPEIQDRWEPKVGDSFYAGLPVDKMKTVVHIETNSHNVHFLKANEHKHAFYHDRVIYIPRIEDVLEWLVSYHFISLHQGSDDWKCERWGMDRMPCEVADSPVKALIKAYMHLEHNKTWNGEEWV